mmetsp:Transcript_23189/g.58780  ORF Transcript_23189/g.58780 Transcript_23189/m.58780 type:complete len:80 (-) Transcript_23189:3-242(-)
MCSMLAVAATVQCKVGCGVSSRHEGDHSPHLTYPSAVTANMIAKSRIPFFMLIQVILLFFRFFRMVVECHIGYILTVQV